MKFHLIALSGVFLAGSAGLRAGCCPHEDAWETHRKAHAIGEYRLESAETFRDAQGRLRTAYQLRLNATLKSGCPDRINWDLPGGQMDDVAEFSSLNPGWKPGEDQILFLHQDASGAWEPIPFRAIRNDGSPQDRQARRDFVRNGSRGKLPVLQSEQEPGTAYGQSSSGVPGSRITPTGYGETSGVPNRFTICDSGAPIACLVDVDASKLPTGVTSAGALQIVNDALGAWSAVSSLKFTIEGTGGFGAGADTISATDQKLRIQLHDHYNRISSTSTLGIGGGSWAIDPPASGPTVAGRTFNRRNYGYVVLNHRASSMANSTNFAEVLTHEIGHALGLLHSSELSNESDSILKNATMYYRLQSDGRGAAIRLYDEDRIAYGYPFNTPPVSMDRTLRTVTGSPQPTGYGVDRIRLNYFDLQSPPSSLTAILVSGSGFTLSGDTLIHKAALYGDALLSDSVIETKSGYELGEFQISDGVNLSPVHRLIITGYHYDSSPSDGLPDSWMATYFGTTNPGAVGNPRHPDSDPDGDGLSNRMERYLGTHPLNAASGMPKMTYDHAAERLSFTPLRYAPHEIESSSDLRTWTKRAQASTLLTPTPLGIDVTEARSAPRMMYRLKIAP